MTPDQYALVHQKAFRTAFDFLNAHFPPAENDEWWLKMAEDCGTASASANSPLATELLTGVVNYINNEFMRRKNNGSVQD